MLTAKCVLQSRKCFFENPTRRSKIKSQPSLSPWSKLLPRAGEDAGATLDSFGNFLRRPSGRRKIDPCEVGGIKAHRASARHRGLNTGVEKIAVLGEIRQ